MDKTLQNKGRILYLDLLRILAVLGSMSVHVSGQNRFNFDVRTYDWIVNASYDYILLGSALPVLIMISGALFLSRDISIEKIYKKYVLRMAIIFLVWSLIYSVLFELIPGHGLKAFFSQFIQGRYHLWVFFMISGMYMITPFLRKIVQDKKLTIYFLILAFIFAVVIENATYLLELFSPEAYELSQIVIKNAHFHFVLGYPIYFVLGYFFNTYGISKKAERWIYILGIFSFVACPVTSILFSLHINEPASPFLITFTFFKSVLVFTLVKNILSAKPVFQKNSKLIQSLSNYTLGAYLVHDIVMNGLSYVFHLRTDTFNPLFSIPIIAAIVAIASYALSAMLNHIPFVKKHFV